MTLQRGGRCGGGDEAGEVGPEAFRRALGCFATGVAVITAAGPEGPAGLVVSSFSSVSLDPPLVGFYVARTSRSWPGIEAAGSFLVNIAAAHHEPACRAVVTRAADRFTGPDWVSRADGPPRLDGALAWIDCAIHRVDDAGDHRNVLGLVTGLAVGVDGSAPLLHHRGGYRLLAPEPPAASGGTGGGAHPALDTPPSKR